MINSNNYMRSKILVVIDHPTMTQKNLEALMVKLCKTAKGRSGREASAHCGDVSVCAPSK